MPDGRLHALAGGVEGDDIRLGSCRACVDHRVWLCHIAHEFPVAIVVERRRGVAQLDKASHKVEQRVSILLLGRYRQPSVLRVYGEVELVGRAGRETSCLAVRPLHGCSCSGALAAAFLGREAWQITHADLVTVIDKRHAGHGEEEGHCHLELLRGVAAARAEALEVVVGCREGHIALVVRGGVDSSVFLVEIVEAAQPALIKIALLVFLSPWIVGGKEERVVDLVGYMNLEVDVEACRYRLLRVGNYSAFLRRRYSEHAIFRS